MTGIRVSTGLPGLDRVLDALRLGDNVVWRVDDLEDYRAFVRPFVDKAMACQSEIVYFRFGQHQPLISETGPRVRVVPLDALSGFDAFTSEVYKRVTDHGPGAFHVFDCLSDLLSAWATDVMVGNLFRVICPRLFQLETVAYFALLTNRHAHPTMARIRETTQVLIDVHRYGNRRFVHPVKADGRTSPTMFLPHRELDGRFEPLIDSTDAAKLQTALRRNGTSAASAAVDYWDRLFIEAAEAVDSEDGADRREGLLERLCGLLMGRDRRMLVLARRYFDLPDLLEVRERMIGSGFIGGKATGMLLARQIMRLRDRALYDKHIAPHDSFLVGTDVYYSWLVHNGWWPRVMRQRTSEGYFSEAATLHADMLNGDLPAEVRPALERMLDHFGQYPILVRSSSLLEDSFGNAFAGKYESVFCVNQGDPGQRLADLERAICRVYASTMDQDALTYRHQRGLDSAEEPMALLLQRVNGRYHGRYYLPDAAGVAVSRNLFAWSQEMDPAAGMVRIVMGLGTRAVDRIEGDHACIIALDQPHRRPWSQEDALRYSQHEVDALDVSDNELRTVPLNRLIEEAPALPFRWLGEVDGQASARSRALGGGNIWRVDFRPLLDRTPFTALMKRVLCVLEEAYDYPVDVEFTLHIGAAGTPTFNPVQCRPLQTLGSGVPVSLPVRVDRSDLLFSTVGHFMGGNMDRRIERVIRVDAARYAALSSDDRHEVARQVGRLTRLFGDGSGTLLIGPGRWGSSRPELGVPVRFADISRVAVLVEVAEMDERVTPDPSFGSHFFLDLVESGIAYVALFPHHADCSYNPAWLDDKPEDAEAVHAVGTDVDDQVSRAVRVHDVRDHRLRVRADVRSRRLVCYCED